MLAITLICQAVLAVVFLASTVGKVRSRAAYREFQSSLVQMRLAPAGSAPVVAVVMIVAEAAVVVAVCTPATTAVGFAIAAAELVLLTGGIVLTMRRGLAAPCRCFGRSRRPLGRIHLIRNAILMAFAIAGVVSSSRLDPAEGIPIATDVALTALAFSVGAIIAGLMIWLEDLVDLFRPMAPEGRR